ncbi:DUF2232 domain-containing protein [Turneriella parva]|uniref:DUF2232 domain-containing protein n=1 Tax=Turneriella parva (strain ATCC BAA-1111 / DSM 21527 / NCTC 11395 / H) TaxID=869212 RepID=I4B8K4_TURPD|nr:DUF2232 domain-containing protein [Turneriella parva]AFM13611.1 hypothetical protein Turpa_2972 [Turneriella parva DSM 21527]
MELLLGFPLSLAFALVPIYLYKSNFDRRIWLWSVVVVTGLFLFLPGRMRVEAFLPGGAAIFYFISGVWVVALNPTSAIFKLLNMPLPTRRELKAEIERIPDVEGRVQKYLSLTVQLKKIWQKRDAFLSGYNSALLLVFTIASSVVSFTVAAYEYRVTGVLKQILDEAYNQWAQRMQAAGQPIVDFRVQLLDYAPTIIFISSFTAVLCLGVFLRIFARIRFKQNVVQGHMSLFRIPDTWVWALIVCGAGFVGALRVEGLKPLMFYFRNGLMVMLFLYMLQGIGVAALFFEVRLMPAHWIALGAMLIGLWMPELIPLMAIIFLAIGLLEVWLALRKRSLRPVTDSDLS